MDKWDLLWQEWLYELVERAGLLLLIAVAFVGLLFVAGPVWAGIFLTVAGTVEIFIITLRAAERVNAIVVFEKESAHTEGLDAHKATTQGLRAKLEEVIHRAKQANDTRKRLEDILDEVSIFDERGSLMKILDLEIQILYRLTSPGNEQLDKQGVETVRRLVEAAFQIFEEKTKLLDNLLASSVAEISRQINLKERELERVATTGERTRLEELLASLHAELDLYGKALGRLKGLETDLDLIESYLHRILADPRTRSSALAQASQIVEKVGKEMREDHSKISTDWDRW